MTTLLLTIIIALGGLLGVAVAWLGYRESHRNNVKADDEAVIKAIISAEMAPLHNQVASITTVLDAVKGQQTIDSGRLGTTLDRLAVLETKVEVFWKDVAMNVSKIIHSPDPRRANIDRLMKTYQRYLRNEGPYLTREQEKELHPILETMMNYEPGQPTDFPIYQGEQVAAGIMLAIMDNFHPRKEELRWMTRASMVKRVKPAAREFKGRPAK
jgi:hypothetical protein